MESLLSRGTHTLSVYVSNKPGVLARIAQVFARRGYNIDSLVVSSSVDGEFSRMTITAKGDPGGLEQIIKQVNKLIDVLHCVDHTGESAVVQELALIKIAAGSDDRSEALQVAEHFKCKTVDLEVPAHAEYVLEGYVVPGETRDEGPFGDHTGYYSPPEPYPVFHVTAMTHRRDPIYPTTMVGRPPTEDFFMGTAATRLMLPALQMTLPEVVDVNMPAEGVFHNLVIVSIRKEYAGHARKVMSALWGLGLMMLAKTIVIVDHNVNVQDLSEVAWRVTANIDPARDIVFVEGPVDDLDHASDIPKFGSKVGIDATAKGPMDGRRREWPADVVMSDEISDLVDRRWDEYGI